MSVSRHLVRKMRKRKRGRRKKDLANTETAVKKGKEKFNCHICRLEPQLQCAASVSKETAELRWAPTCAALVQTPLTTKGAR